MKHTAHYDERSLHICNVAIKNQQLISACLDAGWIGEAKKLRQLDTSLAALFAMSARKAGFNSNQPRVPAGNPDGGQWTDDDRWVGGVAENVTPDLEQYQGNPDLPLEPVYPIENALALFSGLEIIVALRAMIAGRAAVAASSKRIQNANKAIEDYLGGPGKLNRNKHGDPYIIRNDKKIRFDINRPHPHDKPHFHLERQTPSGRWRPATKDKRYDFKE